MTPEERAALRDAIRDEVSGWTIGRGYYSIGIGPDDAREIGDAVLALPEVAERLAALERVEELADKWDVEAAASSARALATRDRLRIAVLRRAITGGES